ncbi:MAG: hypothetical protein ACQESF_01580 [Nanobdellota archaeon]
MHNTEYSILKLFRDNPTKEFATSQIVQAIFPEDNSSTYFGNRHEIAKQAEYKKKLHRNILYHLNKLVEEELLSVVKIGSKGRKYFTLNLREGEELVFRKKKKRLYISKPHLRAMPIEGYEHKNIVFKYEPDTWISRVNALLIQSDKFSINELFRTVVDCFSNVNDVVCLNDFERIVQVSEQREVNAFLRDLALECHDYGRYVTLVIDIKNMRDGKGILQLLETYKSIKQDRITFIFEVTTKDIQNHWYFFEDVIKLFEKISVPLYIKNKDLQPAPHMVGRAGPYTFDSKDWEQYKNKYVQYSKGVVCGFCSIAVDVRRFFQKVRKMDEFRKIISNSMKSLFLANSAQRAHAQEYFRNILRLNTTSPNEFFNIGRNYIRFWNYGWKQPDLDQQLVVNLIKSTRKEVTDFCLTQESIYRACGMPTQFKAAFSCAFSGFSKEKFSEKDYRKTKINDIGELYSGSLKEIMKNKEEIGSTFDGGDRARLVRRGQIKPSEVVRELDLIVNLYKIPLFCYDVGNKSSGELKLTNFIENG